MASLTGNLVKDTYKALLKTSNNDVISGTEVQITDGVGGGTGVFIDTNGFLRASKVTITNGLSTEFLKADGTLDSTTYLDTTTTTSLIAEGSNLYFTYPRVLATTLNGFLATAGNVTASDTILSAIEKIWYNLQTGGGGGGGYVPYSGASQDLDLTPYGLIADFVQLAGGTGDQGTLSWNTDEETADLILNGSTLQLGQEVLVHCRNNTGSTIANGTPCYVTGTLGASGRLTIAPMIADGSIDAKYFIGVATEEIPTDTDGKVCWFGKVRQFDTSGYTEGQILYVSETIAGGWQTTRPVSPNPDLEVAITINSNNNGTIFVRGNQGYELAKNSDVYINTIADNQGLIWDATNERWENRNVVVDSGYIPLSDGDEYGNSVLYENLGFIGLNTTNPLFELDINGDIRIQSGGSYYLGSTAYTIASASNSGFLTSTDWNTFNNKQDAIFDILLPVNGEGLYYNSTSGLWENMPLLVVANYIPRATSGGYGVSKLYDNGTNVGVNTTTPAYLFDVNGDINTSGVYRIGGVDKSTLWNTAYDNMIVSAGVSGTTTKTLTLTQQDGGTIVASWTDYDTAPVTSVFGRTGAVIAQSGDYTTAQVTESGNLYYTDARARASLSFSAGSGAYNSATGVITIPTNNNQITNGAGYITGINSSMVTTALGYTPVPNTRTLTINGTAYDLTADRSWTIAGTIGGLTTNYIPKATSSTTLGNSLIYDNGTGVGIGTTSPSSALTIVGSSNYNTILLRKDNTTNSAQRVGILSRDYSNSGSFGLIGGADIAGTDKIVLVGFDGTSGANTIEFRTASTYAGTTTQRMIINSAGSIGIGTSLPSYKLEVFTNSVLDGILIRGGNAPALRLRDTTDAGDSLIFTNNGGRLVLSADDSNLTANSSLEFKVDGTEYMRITSGGNVGIGTTSPQALLHLSQASSGGSMGAFIVNTASSTLNNSADLYFGTWGGSSVAGITNARISALNVNAGNASTDLLFYTYNGSSSGERMRIQSDGDVQITGAFEVLKLTSGYTSGGNYINFSNASGLLMTLGYTQNSSDNFFIRNYKNSNTYFYNNNSIYMTATSGGYVGINNTNPTALLDIQTTSTSGNADIAYFGRATFGTTLKIARRLGSGEIGSPQNLYLSADYNNSQTSTNSNIIFETDSSERMRITSDGNIKIGTGTASYKLDVAGHIRGENIYIDNSSGTGGIFRIDGYQDYLYIYGSTSNLLGYRFGSDTAGIKMSINTSGRVLIGTTSEWTGGDAPLQLYATTNPQITYTSGQSSQRWVSGLAGSDGSAYNIYDITNDRRLISARTDNTVIIGNAGVSGGGMLQVNGDVNINGNFKINGTTIGGGGGSGVTGSGTTNTIPKWTNSSTLGNSIITEATNNSITINGPYLNIISGGYPLNFYVNTSNGIMSIGKSPSFAIHMNQSNLVGINTTSFQSGNTLTCDGNAYFIGVVSASSYVTLSDIRLKTDVVELDKGLNEIIQLAPKSYKKDNSAEYGLIAQEVESILPQLVHNKNTYKSLKYMELIPILINAVKELDAKVKFLESK